MRSHTTIRRLAGALAVLAVWAVSVPMARAGGLEGFVKDAEGKPVADAVVSAVAVPGSRTVNTRAGRAIVDQQDKEFVPHVLPVLVGTEVSFPNRDNIRHHVYSFSPPKRFELPLYRGTPAQPVLFDKPGIIKLGCNIHDWMVGYIYVTETPYFGKTAGEGLVELDGLPPGRYRVRVWHPRISGTEADTNKEIGLQTGDVPTLEWKLRLNPEFRPPRVPVPGDAGYR